MTDQPVEYFPALRATGICRQAFILAYTSPCFSLGEKN
jgi:hypothetical protein